MNEKQDPINFYGGAKSDQQEKPDTFDQYDYNLGTNTKMVLDFSN